MLTLVEFFSGIKKNPTGVAGGDNFFIYYSADSEVFSSASGAS